HPVTTRLGDVISSRYRIMLDHKLTYIDTCKSLREDTGSDLTFDLLGRNPSICRRRSQVKNELPQSSSTRADAEPYGSSQRGCRAGYRSHRFCRRAVAKARLQAHQHHCE